MSSISTIYRLLAWQARLRAAELAITGCPPIRRHLKDAPPSGLVRQPLPMNRLVGGGHGEEQDGVIEG